MVPERVNMTHELVQNYRMFPHMTIIKPHPATEEQLKQIHLPGYIDYLKKVSPLISNGLVDLYPCLQADDCPTFTGVYDYSASIVGASIACANRINHGRSNICINWAGGMHHAKRRFASGFCYANDIAAAILELLTCHRRVMYVDIDVHHGDGVEEFFYNTNRVMTISFHRHGNGFFPGTGSTAESGVGLGKDYAINVPLHKGITDDQYIFLYKNVLMKAMERFQPEALVMQMGADSVVGDKLGDFNLTNQGHANCLKHALTYNLPTIVLGGGGYSVKNVARTWTLETATILGLELDNKLPANSYFGHLPEDQNLIIPAIKMSNLNSMKEIKAVQNQVYEVLGRTEIAPSVPLQETPLVPEDEMETV
ncbi:Histone deacetylase 2, variant 2 [Entomophthora muscae]|uniref:Histone deacetylase 2, variant 2 n=1 Tax=Entomophthora muscae TaxID=34485 RepID=A0ACC2RJ79_9FUNG|nr:Histone deacetylase 2, variant 2 [Entomophthora muscae]